MSCAGLRRVEHDFRLACKNLGECLPEQTTIGLAGVARPGRREITEGVRLTLSTSDSSRPGTLGSLHCARCLSFGSRECFGPIRLGGVRPALEVSLGPGDVPIRVNDRDRRMEILKENRRNGQTQTIGVDPILE